MTHPTLAPGKEELFVLDATRATLRGRGVESASERLDWERVTRLARAHGVLPLVRRAVATGLVGDEGGSGRRVLGPAADAAATRSLYLASALLQLLDSLASRSIRASPWKGPVLAAALWGDVAMRQYADLDILVRREEMSAARDCLLDLGFRLAAGRPEWQDEEYIAHVGAIELVRDRDALVVEIHWTATPNYFTRAMDAGGIWSRLEEARIGRTPVFTLASDDLLIALAIHGFKHRWERLGWIVDVAKLLERCDDVEVAALARRARAGGSARLVRIAAGVAATMFDLPESRTRRAALGRDTTAERIVAELAPTVLRRMPEGHFHQSPWEDLRARERLRDRVEYVVRFVTTPTLGDWAAVRLPRRLAGIHRLLRPFRLVALALRRRRTRAPRDDGARSQGSVRP